VFQTVVTGSLKLWEEKYVMTITRMLEMDVQQTVKQLRMGTNALENLRSAIECLSLSSTKLMLLKEHS
jgi:hypothetical protein